MSRDDRKSSKVLALCTTIALGAFIAHNLPPTPNHKPHRRRRHPQHDSDVRPPPAWPKVPPLGDASHYREERYHLKYGAGDKPGDLVCVVDQRPLDGSVTGPEARQESEADRKERNYQVERYYRLDGTEAGPDEAHRIVKRGYPKWDR